MELTLHRVSFLFLKCYFLANHYLPFEILILKISLESSIK